MKTRTQMTLSPNFLRQIDELLEIAGLTRSGYVENCMSNDIISIRKLLNDPEVMRNYDNKNTIILNYFRGRIGEGEY